MPRPIANGWRFEWPKVLFHQALGLTPGVARFAQELRAAEHTVHTLDLFAGRTFDTLDAGPDTPRR